MYFAFIIHLDIFSLNESCLHFFYFCEIIGGCVLFVSQFMCVFWGEKYNFAFIMHLVVFFFKNVAVTFSYYKL